MKKALAIWIWLCAWLICISWFLSALRELNAAGYAVALVLGVAVFFAGKKFLLPPKPPALRGGSGFTKFFRRFKKAFPLAFLVLSALAFLGGAIYAPNNYDGLTYRIPRVLHWLAADQWHWIHTSFPRVNASSCGIEWISAPLLVFFKTDRLIFLVNFVSFLFLPGLVFSLLTRLGVRHAVAWHWMWIFPSGYCFVLQAGSISNDTLAAPFALAAIDFALRSKDSKDARDLFCSTLAAALMTSVKFSNLPLLLPWGIAIFPSLKIFLQRPVATVAVCGLAVFASFLPKAALNQHYCHDWSGVSLENDQPHGSPALRTAVNITLIGLFNLTPPVFPEADRWNRFMQNTIPPKLHLKLEQTMAEPDAMGLQVQQMQIEECAGLGFGVTIFLVVSVVIAARGSGKLFSTIQFHPPEAVWRTAIILTPWISAFALITRSEVYPIGRILAPYYVLLLPLLLAFPAHEPLVKKFAWRTGAFLVFAMAAGLVIICPARPLFPVETILGAIQAHHPDSKLLARAEEVYSVYHDRSHAFAPAINTLPLGLKVLGFVTYDDPETSLWQPFGSRQIVHVCPDDSPAYLKSRGIEYILAKNDRFGTQFPAFGDWLKQMNAAVVQKIHLNLRASGESADWWLVELN
jgi:hypothetical protein